MRTKAISRFTELLWQKIKQRKISCTC